MKNSRILLKIFMCIFWMGGAFLMANAETLTAEHARDPELPLGRKLRERLAGWHLTIAVTDESVPNSALLRYRTVNHDPVYFNYLAKLLPILEKEGQRFMPSQAQDLQVEDFYGGVEAHWKYGDTAMRSEYLPLMVGRDAKEPEGLVLYQIKTDGPGAVEVLLGGGDKLGLVWGPSKALRSDEVADFLGDITFEQGTAFTLSSRDDSHVAVRCSGMLEADGQKLTARFEEAEGFVLVAYAQSRERVAELIATDAEEARTELEAYYDKLMVSYLKTPEPDMDAAFKSVFYNLEYNYLKPYGWMECAHHWIAMWHMHLSGGAEWMGQVDRSRLSHLTHMDNMLPSGAVPQMCAGGQTRRDFGGSNQFFAWQLRHYFNFTNDVEFAERAYETMKGVIAQTLEEHDEDNDGLVAWGKQIGNQEDFIHTPHDGGTPSMEMVNMLRTQVLLARGMGKEEEAQYWEARSNAVLSELKKQLWMPDLGRFAYFRDQEGNLRLDGQYHTFIYPLHFNLVDAKDGYASLRHLRDRLADPDGEIYLSNNFPTHMVGTWGMQAGAAQQPWAAWGLSDAGLHNEAYRPLKAVAGWVNDLNHRGGWPEVSKETPPGYFTPPAGLYVASVCEALFGLNMKAPQNTIVLSPSFPDHWPEAELNLPEFKAAYERDGNRLTYRLKTTDALKRQMQWKLPPCNVKKVTWNGDKVDFEVKPGVEYITVEWTSPAEKESEVEIVFSPRVLKWDYPRSIAEGEDFHLRLEGGAIRAVDDRYGLLGAVEMGEENLWAEVKTNLLTPYMQYGRLGQLNFSRRTFFVKVELDEDGLYFWKAIDLALLPATEAAPAGEIVIREDKLEAPLTLRNNRDVALDGLACLQVSEEFFSFPVDLEGRSEDDFSVDIPANLATLFSIGDNRANLILPNGDRHELTLTLNSALKENAPLLETLASRVKALDLSDQPWRDQGIWQLLRRHKERHAAVTWPGANPPMNSMAGQTSLTLEALPGLNFPFKSQQIIPVGHLEDYPEMGLDLKDNLYQKFYILLFSFLDNSEMFTPVGRVTLYTPEEAIQSRTLHFPGDVDWADAAPVYPEIAMSTARHERKNRFGLLSALSPDQADYPEGTAPAFPQPEFWASSRVYRTGVSNLNVLEIHLKKAMPIRRLILSPIGPEPAFGVLSVLAEEPGDDCQELVNTPWFPPSHLLPPRTLFETQSEEDVAGWETEGNTFGVSSTFEQTPSFHSRFGGEEATGQAVSPVFTLQEGETELLLVYQGGRSVKVEGEENLAIRIVDGETMEVLREMPVSGNHILRQGKMDVRGLAGRKLRLVLRDENRNSTYAWLGLQKVRARRK